MTEQPADAQAASHSRPSRRDEEEGNAAGDVPSADGRGASLDAVVCADRGSIPKGGPKDSDAFWGVMRNAPKGGELDEPDEQINRILKRQFGHGKTRYRGSEKNRAHLFTLFALGNFFLV